MRVLIALLSLILFGVACAQKVIVLGIAQDGGFPHIGCQKECQLAHEDPSLARFVTSLALIDPASKQWWLFEATPDISNQLQLFQQLTNQEYPYLPAGIFITHAHMGHYTGLMQLGREALGAKGLPVYVLPRMKQFLETNGPWSQLVDLNNITIRALTADKGLVLQDKITVEPFTVPHRDEFSETAAFRIKTSSQSYLFIPDIDKWEKWDRNIIEEVEKVDVAFLDATFYADGELPNRAMSEVPHPFVAETMQLFRDEPSETKAKIHFIHLNHTNPLLFDPEIQFQLKKKGFHMAQQGSNY